MNPLLSSFIFLLTFGLLIGCQSKKNSDNIETELQEVTGGCIRINEIDYRVALTNFDSLGGKNQKEVIKHLGMPLRTQLYDRGQKFLFYGINCDSAGAYNKVLRIRINALSLANEMLIIDEEL